jgi:hypothetical protein
VPAAVGVNFSEQVPLESLQASLENLPGLLLDQVTLPVGKVLEPRTIALQMVAEPTTTEARLHDKVRVGSGRGLAATRSVDELTESATEKVSATISIRTMVAEGWLTFKVLCHSV